MFFTKIVKLCIGLKGHMEILVLRLDYERELVQKLAITAKFVSTLVLVLYIDVIK